MQIRLAPLLFASLIGLVSIAPAAAAQRTVIARCDTDGLDRRVLPSCWSGRYGDRRETFGDRLRLELRSETRASERAAARAAQAVAHASRMAQLRLQSEMRAASLRERTVMQRSQREYTRAIARDMRNLARTRAREAARFRREW